MSFVWVVDVMICPEFGMEQQAPQARGGFVLKRVAGRLILPQTADVSRKVLGKTMKKTEHLQS